MKFTLWNLVWDCTHSFWVSHSWDVTACLVKHSIWMSHCWNVNVCLRRALISDEPQGQFLPGFVIILLCTFYSIFSLLWLFLLCYDSSYFVCVDFTHLVLLWLHIFWWLFRLLMSLRLDHFGSPEKEKLFFAEIWSKIKEITLRFITDKRPPQGDMVIKVVEIQTKSDISAVKHSKGVYNQTCSDIPAVRHSKGVCTVPNQVPQCEFQDNVSNFRYFVPIFHNRRDIFGHFSHFF